MVFVVAEIIDDHDDTNDYIVNVVAMTVEESTITMYFNVFLMLLLDICLLLMMRSMDCDGVVH